MHAVQKVGGGGISLLDCWLMHAWGFQLLLPSTCLSNEKLGRDYGKTLILALLINYCIQFTFRTSRDMQTWLYRGDIISSDLHIDDLSIGVESRCHRKQKVAMSGGLCDEVGK